MNAKTEGTMAIVAALVVLLSAMWDPRISVVVAVGLMAIFGVLRLVSRGG